MGLSEKQAARRAKRRRRGVSTFPTAADIRAAWELAEKVDPLLVDLMEAKTTNA